MNQKHEQICDDCHVYSFADSPTVYYRSCRVTSHCISPMGRLKSEMLHATPSRAEKSSSDFVEIPAEDFDCMVRRIIDDGFHYINTRFEKVEAVSLEQISASKAQKDSSTDLVLTVLKAITEINTRLEKLEAVSHVQITEDDIRARLKILEDARKNYIPPHQPWPWPHAMPQWDQIQPFDPKQITAIC